MLNTGNLAQAAQATATTNRCEEQLRSCEDVLATGELVIKRQAETIAALSDQNEALKRALETATPIVNAPPEPWYKHPALWFAIGVGAGVAVSK